MTSSNDYYRKKKKLNGNAALSVIHLRTTPRYLKNDSTMLWTQWQTVAKNSTI